MAVKIVTRKNLDKEDEKGIHSHFYSSSLLIYDHSCTAGLRQEVDILRSMKHSNIVQCYDFFEEPDKFYVVLEFLEGNTLSLT